ncbi:MAG: hypothetical protein V2A79_16540 [Planctomycetota bacterium]
MKRRPREKAMPHPARENPAVLDAAFLLSVRRRIEEVVVPVMERIYGHGRTAIPESFRPELTAIERVVSFYDYQACGLSVLAPLAAAGDRRAAELVRIIRANMEHYRTRIHNREVPGFGPWTVPLRRLLFHAALAYRALEPTLGAREKRAYRRLVERQVAAAIEHNERFHPGERRLHLGFANNHTAIFMQGVYHCGRVFGRPEWVRLAREFAERFYASGHPDGYWEENTNPAREGGPSAVYTPLTAGCLYDVLDGRRRPRVKFLRAGRFFRSFLTSDGTMIPLADERTNAHARHSAYGLALHSLTPKGRGHIVGLLGALDLSGETPETLAVLHHELGLMRTGRCAAPEYRTDGYFRITLPLGVVRRDGWMAAISAMRALNRVHQPANDYALDHQAVVFLAHRETGAVLTGIKSKHDPEFSTIRIGRDDGYPVDTGTLRMGADWAEARLHYAKFDATARWDLGRRARLTLATDDRREVTTALPIRCPKCLRTDAPFEMVNLKGFSPYSTGNASEPVTAARFSWRRRLVVEFQR